MSERFITDNPELDALFERYRQAPRSHVFAPLADACRKAGLIDEAVDIADRGVKENPGYTSGHVVRGKCYYDRGDRRTAVSCFERVLDLDPNNLVALKFLGLIQAEEGDASGARERFKHILALDPDDREIRRELDILDVPAAQAPPAAAQPSPEPGPARPAAVPVEKDPEEGFEGAPISLGTDDDPTTDELATMTLADIYAEQGYADKALRIYREVLKRQPRNTGVREKIRALGGEVPELDPLPEADDTPVHAADAPGSEHFEDAPGMGHVEDASAPEHFEDAPGMGLPPGAAEPVEVLEHSDLSGPVVDSDEGADAGDPSFPPAPGVIELPPPEDMDLDDAAPERSEDEDDATEAGFEEFAPGVETAKAKEKPAADDDPNSPLPYQRRDGTIDEGRSYEQFKRWLKNLAD